MIYDPDSDDTARRMALLGYFGGWERSLDPRADFRFPRTYAREENILQRVVKRNDGRFRAPFGTDFWIQDRFAKLGIFDHVRALGRELLLMQPYLSAVNLAPAEIAAGLQEMGSAARVIGYPPYNTNYCVGFVIYRADNWIMAHALEATPNFKEASR